MEDTKDKVNAYVQYRNQVISEHEILLDRVDTLENTIKTLQSRVETLEFENHSLMLTLRTLIQIKCPTHFANGKLKK